MKNYGIRKRLDGEWKGRQEEVEDEKQETVKQARHEETGIFSDDEMVEGWSVCRRVWDRKIRGR